MLPLLRIPCALTLALAPTLTSCVTYTADEADPATVAAEVQSRSGGSFTFAAACRLAMRQNPELRATAARATAAGAALVPFQLEAEYRDGPEMLEVMLDPIALLDLGPRGAANDALTAAAATATTELATARWRVAVALAEAFAIERALQQLTVPEVAIDADAYERVGLASPVDAARLRAAQAGCTAEQRAVEAEQVRNHNAVRRLLGLPMSATIALVLDAPLPRADRSEAALLRRPDLALATMRFRQADAEFRAAVAAQYPTLMLGPEIALGSSVLEWMAVVRLPLGAHGAAAAAQARRDAAREDLQGAFLTASEQAHDLEAEWLATDAGIAAARASVEASTSRLTAALTTITVDGGAFAPLAEAANKAVRAAADRRRAELAHSRTTIARDAAYGWPAVQQATASATERQTP